MRQVKNEADFVNGTQLLMMGLMQLTTWEPEEKRERVYENLKNIRDMLNAAPFVYADGFAAPAALDSPEKAAEIASIAKAFASAEKLNADLFAVPVAAGMTC